MLSSTTVKAPVASENSESILSRPRPPTRRFYLDRLDVERLCGARAANRLRQKIPQKIIEAESRRATTDKAADEASTLTKSGLAVGTTAGASGGAGVAA